MLKVVCRCRNCGIMYDCRKSRADYKGFCSAACVHEKAHVLGFRKRAGKWTPSGKTEYAVLKRHNAIGDVVVAVCDWSRLWLTKIRQELLKEIKTHQRATSLEELKEIEEELALVDLANPRS